jgi:hypothetical protein
MLIIFYMIDSVRRMHGYVAIYANWIELQLQIKLLVVFRALWYKRPFMGAIVMMRPSTIPSNCPRTFPGHNKGLAARSCCNKQDTRTSSSAPGMHG